MSSSSEIGSKLHHRDIVGLALRRLKRDLDQNSDVMDEFSKELGKN